jgi:hypothetical protein
MHIQLCSPWFAFLHAAYLLDASPTCDLDVPSSVVVTRRHGRRCTARRGAGRSHRSELAGDSSSGTQQRQPAPKESRADVDELALLVCL